LLRYDIVNTNASAINNLYAGIFFDWDMLDGSDDFTGYDSSENFGYCYHVGGSPDNWVAAALVSSDNYGFWAINNQGGDGGFNIYDGFTDTEKWQALSSGVGKPQAGAGDISHVISSGPYSIQPNDTIHIAFAVAAGFSINDLRNAITNARIKYSQIPTAISFEDDNIPRGFYLSQNHPNPFNPSTKIRWQSHVGAWQTLKVFDVLGNEVATLMNGYAPAGSYEVEFSSRNILTSGVYFYRLQVREFVEIKKMILLR
jgi:hypothetical protein